MLTWAGFDSTHEFTSPCTTPRNVLLIRQTKDKQGEIEALLGKMSEADFPKLVRLGQNITDYGQDEVRNYL